jgi:hypothetical protein
MHDVNILDHLLPEAGAFYVMDRVLPGNFSGFGRNGRSRDGSRASCGVTNVQLLQRFRLVLRAHAEWQRGCSTCLAGRIRTSVGAKKIIPHRASFCARLVARTEHAWWPEPDRLTPLPRQRPWVSAGFGWWRRVVAPPRCHAATSIILRLRAMLNVYPPNKSTAEMISSKNAASHR